MGWPTINGRVPDLKASSVQIRPPHWIILGLLILCINTQQSTADVKELTGKCKCKYKDCKTTSMTKRA